MCIAATHGLQNIDRKYLLDFQTISQGIQKITLKITEIHPEINGEVVFLERKLMLFPDLQTSHAPTYFSQLNTKKTPAQRESHTGREPVLCSCVHACVHSQPPLEVCPYGPGLRLSRCPGPGPEWMPWVTLLLPLASPSCPPLAHLYTFSRYAGKNTS